MASYSPAVNIHEQHREIIVEATQNISSRNFARKNSAIDALMRILNGGSINAYHKAQSYSLLAMHSDPDDVDVENCAKQCLEECNRVIMQEGMTWMSYARQPWDDLVNAARDVLRKIEEAEEGVRAYQGALRRIEAGNDGSDEEYEEVQTGVMDEDMDGDPGNFESRYGDSVRDNQFNTDFNHALNELDLAVDEFAPPAPIRVGISMEDVPTPYNPSNIPSGRQLQPYDADDAYVIQIFVLLLLRYGPECRLDMQRIIERYTEEKRIGSDQLLGQIVRGLEGLVIRTKPREDEVSGEGKETEECD